MDESGLLVLERTPVGSRWTFAPDIVGSDDLPLLQAALRPLERSAILDEALFGPDDGWRRRGAALERLGNWLADGISDAPDRRDSASPSAFVHDALAVRVSAAGRGLVASEAIRAGELLLREPPYAAVLYHSVECGHSDECGRRYSSAAPSGALLAVRVLLRASAAELRAAADGALGPGSAYRRVHALQNGITESK